MFCCLLPCTLQVTGRQLEVCILASKTQQASHILPSLASRPHPGMSRLPGLVKPQACLQMSVWVMGRCEVTVDASAGHFLSSLWSRSKKKALPDQVAQCTGAVLAAEDA